MFKKRTIKGSTRRRELSEEPSNTEDMTEEEGDQEEPMPSIEDLIALRKLRKLRQGIDAAKLTQGEVKKKRRRVEEEEPQHGLQKPATGQTADPAEDDDDPTDDEAKARKIVRSNNFTQQTDKLDVDKHMMAYIEENMKAARGESSNDFQEEDEEVYDPHAQLYHIDERYKIKKQVMEEGSVTSSVAMLTAIPEVDLGIDTRLRNIEDTEKAKRTVEEEKKSRRNDQDEADAISAATRFFRPHHQVTSDAEALKNAKLEAMGIEPTPAPRRQHDRKEMATDEMVMERFKKRMRRPDLSAGLPDLPTIDDEAITARVFTHRSLFMRSHTLFQDADDDPAPDNERLEFLGDSALGLATATLLENYFPRLRVGPTSKVKALIVSNENLSSICRHYKLNARLRCAANQQMTLQNSQLIQANLLESYIGGLYLNKGFSAVIEWLIPALLPYAKEAFEEVKKEHRLHLNPSATLEDGEYADSNRGSSPPVGSVVDPGTLSFFNQWCSQNKKQPDWRFNDIAGTKATPLWSVEVWLDDIKIGDGVSTGKKGAKTEAAKKAMRNLGIDTGF
ncbi:hypothetical protein FRB97_005269 [Tulasnella sp. 331]|nr:hypothetical protein FRB97_005269 [Tulasnella sp. 331]